MDNVNNMWKILVWLSLAFVVSSCSNPPENTMFKSGEIWNDDNGNHINAHAGGILAAGGSYFWFGEFKTSGKEGNLAQYGVSCYKSDDLMNWTFEGIALEVDTIQDSEITKGCIIERPKVIFNKSTQKYVMWFHLELKGEGYGSARTGVAISDNVTGPYKFVRSYRPNAGKWPEGFSEEQKNRSFPDDYTWWTDEFFQLVNDGLFVSRDFKKGQMSRDMTVYVDEDGKAYHIHSSEENLTIHISELTDDYLGFTGRWKRVFPGGHNEAPAIFKRNGKYYMITSGCTGWDPNAARLAMADSIMGDWTYIGNPCIGEGADKTFSSQSTFVLELEGEKDAYIFMADRWRPRNPVDGRYVWLPIEFKSDTPVLQWNPAWDMTCFKSK